jgi:hypothetical protein
MELAWPGTDGGRSEDYGSESGVENDVAQPQHHTSQWNRSPKPAILELEASAILQG